MGNTQRCRSLEGEAEIVKPVTVLTCVQVTVAYRHRAAPPWQHQQASYKQAWLASAANGEKGSWWKQCCIGRLAQLKSGPGARQDLKL